MDLPIPVELRQQCWQSQYAATTEICKKGIEKYLKPCDPSRLFWKPQIRVCGCCDEGVLWQHASLRTMGALHRLRTVLRHKILAAAEVAEVRPHPYCAHFRRVVKDAGKPAADSDQEFVDYTRQLASEVEGLRAGTETGLRRPPNFHPAQMLTLDGTPGLFNPDSHLIPLHPEEYDSKEHIYPQSLCLTHYYLDKLTWWEVEQLIRMALGPHGAGPHDSDHPFTKKHPFLLVVIGHPTDPSFAQAKIEKRAKVLLESMCDKPQSPGDNPGDIMELVKITGFTPEDLPL